MGDHTFGQSIRSPTMREFADYGCSSSGHRNTRAARAGRSFDSVLALDAKKPANVHKRLDEIYTADNWRPGSQMTAHSMPSSPKPDIKSFHMAKNPHLPHSHTPGGNALHRTCDAYKAAARSDERHSGSAPGLDESTPMDSDSTSDLDYAAWESVSETSRDYDVCSVANDEAPYKGHYEDNYHSDAISEISYSEAQHYCPPVPEADDSGQFVGIIDSARDCVCPGKPDRILFSITPVTDLELESLSASEDAGDVRLGKLSLAELHAHYPFLDSGKREYSRSESLVTKSSDDDTIHRPPTRQETFPHRPTESRRNSKESEERAREHRRRFDSLVHKLQLRLSGQSDEQAHEESRSSNSRKHAHHAIRSQYSGSEEAMRLSQKSHRQNASSEFSTGSHLNPAASEFVSSSSSGNPSEVVPRGPHPSRKTASLPFENTAGHASMEQQKQNIQPQRASEPSMRPIAPLTSVYAGPPLPSPTRAWQQSQQSHMQLPQPTQAQPPQPPQPPAQPTQPTQPQLQQPYQPSLQMPQNPYGAMPNMEAYSQAHDPFGTFENPVSATTTATSQDSQFGPGWPTEPPFAGLPNAFGTLPPLYPKPPRMRSRGHLPYLPLEAAEQQRIEEHIEAMKASVPYYSAMVRKRQDVRWKEKQQRGLERCQQQQLQQLQLQKQMQQQQQQFQQLQIQQQQQLCLLQQQLQLQPYLYALKPQQPWMPQPNPGLGYVGLNVVA